VQREREEEVAPGVGEPAEVAGGVEVTLGIIVKVA
jgi:hypothetical protein